MEFPILDWKAEHHIAFAPARALASDVGVTARIGGSTTRE